MEEDNLDSFLKSGLSQQSAPAPNENPAGTVLQRPKLRKIKRPKVRPMADLPSALAKVNPVEANEADINRNTLVESQAGNAALGASEPADADGLAANFNAKEEENGGNTGTNLISATDAQNLTAGQDYNNPYVVDGLPPELDYVTDEDVADYGETTGYIKKSVLYIVAGVCLFIGLFIGKTLFSSQTVENHGLEGVVANPDVPAGRPRCGLTDKSQACILYIMNCYKQELNGRNFYKLAAQLTGREEYMIDTDNLRYATVKIKPGHFAQLNIPALK